MCTSHDHDLGEAPQAGAGRRGFLRATALLGATAAAVTALPAATAQAAASTWHPDPRSRRFTVAVMPDTQYLFDGPSIDKAPVEASLRYLLEHGREENIVFLSHLGDLTQNGAKEEFAAIGEAFRLLDRRGVGYSILAGNHDVRSSTTDQRGATPYLDAFGPKRFEGQPTFGGASPDGYNTFHRFAAGGREWLVLALDWRLSPQGYAWAKGVLAKHPKTPVILTTHELVVEDDTLSDYGQQLWDQLIEDHDQIFLALGGHYWPAARATGKNAAGNDVHLHLTNYQNRYFGGAAMIRLYRFDLDRGVIDVETLSPWILGRAGKGLRHRRRRRSGLVGRPPPRPAGPRQPGVPGLQVPAEGRVSEDGRRRPAQRGDVQGRLHDRGVLPAARRLGPGPQRLVGSGLPHGNGRRRREDRRRPGRAAGDAVAVQRP